MKIKEIGQRLDAFECVQLLDKAMEYGIYERDDDNIKVYRCDIGWCSIPVTVCANELSLDLSGQTFIRERLKMLGVELNSFLEYQSVICLMG